MKLSQVLSSLNQIEKSKFISCLDKLCTQSAQNDTLIASSMSQIDGQIKNASGSEITSLFSLVAPTFKTSIQEQISMSGADIGLMVNIIARDGNCLARTSWIETLYNREWTILDELSKQLDVEIANSGDELCRSHLLSIYKDCLNTAFTNDHKSNRQAKITDDERTILNVLAAHLNISKDEAAAIEHLIDPIPQNIAEDTLNNLREMGVVFINRKRNEVLVAEEIVAILNELLGKELADKHMLRILRCLTDGELANILKQYGKRVRGIVRTERIKEIIHSGISIRTILTRDLYPANTNLHQRKERLKNLITDLDIIATKMGATIDDRIDVIIDSLNQSTGEEFNVLSAAGFKELFAALQLHYPKFDSILKSEFELEESEAIDTDKLRALSITPVDILYLLSNEQIKEIRDKMGLAKRGNPRHLILESFANANDKLVENYEALAKRDLAGLKEAGIDIAEADLGIKFEEITKEILESMKLNVDEDLRKSINSAKDKTDIIVSLSDDDIIIGEAKTCKNGDFAKYSTTSRQVKAYVNRCESQGKRVAQVLIIAPSFSQDFVESAEMDTDINISLLEASGLKQIYDAFKARRNPKFSAKLLTKGGLLKTALIAKHI